MQYVTSSFVNLLLNGSLYGKIYHGYGLRQGDPISPYLFITCSEVLRHMLFKAEANGDVEDIKLSKNGSSFNHTLFVDDLTLFGRVNKKETYNLMACIDLYYSWSSQKANKEKSFVLFSKNFGGQKSM